MSFICKMIKVGWANNKMLIVLWIQDGKSLQSGQFSLSDVQRRMSVSWNKLGPRVRWERAHLRLPLPGWMPDVPRLWNGHGKRGLWTESVILNNSACLLSCLFKECERQCVLFHMPWTWFSQRSLKGVHNLFVFSTKATLNFRTFSETSFPVSLWECKPGWFCLNIVKFQCIWKAGILCDFNLQVFLPSCVSISYLKHLLYAVSFVFSFQTVAKQTKLEQDEWSSLFFLLQIKDCNQCCLNKWVIDV